MSEWKEIVFSDLFSEGTRNGVFKTNGKPVVDARLIGMGTLFHNDFIRRSPEETLGLTADEYARFSVRAGDLLFGRRSLVESGAGKVSLVVAVDSPTVFESSLIRVRLDPSKADPRFYAYYFKAGVGRGRIFALVNGAAVKGIRSSDLQKVVVHCPPLPTQKRIADILSAYDDLIENNRRRMEILEESARLIYRKMFGDGVPDADRWPVVKIGDILCKVHRAVKIPKDEYCESGTYPCIDQSREFIGGYTNNEAAVNHDLPAIVFGDHTRILKFVRFPFASGADGTQLIRSNDGRISQEFLYYALLEIDLTNYFYARHFKILKSKDLRLPPFDLIAEFTRLVSPMTERTAVLLKENIKLAEARDMLLSKLMRDC